MPASEPPAVVGARLPTLTVLAPLPTSTEVGPSMVRMLTVSLPPPVVMSVRLVRTGWPASPWVLITSRRSLPEPRSMSSHSRSVYVAPAVARPSPVSSVAGEHAVVLAVVSPVSSKPERVGAGASADHEGRVDRVEEAAAVGDRAGRCR